MQNMFNFYSKYNVKNWKLKRAYLFEECSKYYGLYVMHGTSSKYFCEALPLRLGRKWASAPANANVLTLHSKHTFYITREEVSLVDTFDLNKES